MEETKPATTTEPALTGKKNGAGLREEESRERDFLSGLGVRVLPVMREPIEREKKQELGRAKERQGRRRAPPAKPATRDRKRGARASLIFGK